MSGAQVILAVNISVGAMFAFGFAIVALTNRGQRSALWFSLGYVIGVLSPISDFLIPLVGAPQPLEWVAYTSFLAALLSISATFAMFHRTSTPWVAMLTIFLSGVIVRATIWDLPRDTLGYGLAYQMPFVLAALCGTYVVLKVADRRPLHLLLATIYAIIAVHFLGKPFLAIKFGSGETLADYSQTTYALLSQSSTGVLLLASGVLLLLVVAQKAISESLQESETDALSGLANRRGLMHHGQAAIARTERQDAPMALALFDLDHFKTVNDTYGHEAGDWVIADFAALLREQAPSAALVARLGGEEFVMLLEGATAQVACLHAERIRMAAAAAIRPGRPSPTVSVGVAERTADESLTGMLRRADAALYRAKSEGRNRVHLASEMNYEPSPALRLAGVA